MALVCVSCVTQVILSNIDLSLGSSLCQLCDTSNIDYSLGSSLCQLCDTSNIDYSLGSSLCQLCDTSKRDFLLIESWQLCPYYSLCQFCDTNNIFFLGCILCQLCQVRATSKNNSSLSRLSSCVYIIVRVRCLPQIKVTSPYRDLVVVSIS